MKKLILALTLLTATSAYARNATKHMIDKLVLNGDIAITFKPNGEASTVTCNSKKYSKHHCEHTGEHVFEYFKEHPKGHNHDSHEH